MQSSTAGFNPGTFAQSTTATSSAEFAGDPAPKSSPRPPAPPLTGPIASSSPIAGSSSGNPIPSQPAGSASTPPPVASRHDTRPRPPARHTYFTPAFGDLLVAVVRENGFSPTAAAEQAGFGRSTLYRWRLAYPDFDARLSRARMDFRRSRLAVIRNATTKDGRPDWRTAAWELERAFPEEYCMNPKRRAAFRDLRIAEDAAHEARCEEYEARLEKLQKSQPAHGEPLPPESQKLQNPLPPGFQPLEAPATPPSQVVAQALLPVNQPQREAPLPPVIAEERESDSQKLQNSTRTTPAARKLQNFPAYRSGPPDEEDAWSPEFRALAEENALAMAR